jgi:hypothetical protein
MIDARVLLDASSADRKAEAVSAGENAGLMIAEVELTHAHQVRDVALGRRRGDTSGRILPWLARTTALHDLVRTPGLGCIVSSLGVGKVAGLPVLVTELGENVRFPCQETQLGAMKPGAEQLIDGVLEGFGRLEHTNRLTDGVDVIDSGHGSLEH